jgi:hypothetical protein
MADGNLTGIRRRDRRRLTVVLRPAAADPETIGGADQGEGEAASTALTYFDDYGGGSPQSLTASLAPLFVDGGSEPTTILTEPGVYLLLAQAQFEATGATVTTESITFELYRNNNTPGSIANSTVAIDLPVMITATMTIGAYTLPAVVYTTANDDDEIVIAGVISASLAAGTIDASGAAIVAIKIG